MFRDGGFGILDVPELTATGQARSRATAKDTARELVALWLDTPVDQVQVVMATTVSGTAGIRLGRRHSGGGSCAPVTRD